MEIIEKKTERRIILPDDAVEYICEDHFDQSCLSLAFAESGCNRVSCSSCENTNTEATDFADSIIGFLIEGLGRDNKIVDLFDRIDNNLDVCFEDLSAAHLTSLVWCILSTIHFSDMEIGADDAAEILNDRIVQAIRQALIDIYEADIDA